MQRRFFGLLLLFVAGGLATGAWLVSRPPSPDPAPLKETADDPPRQPAGLPPVAGSRFLNTRAEARYVGTARCAECHPGEHDSYLRTPHSRALADIDLEHEAWDVEFQHPRSRRKYSVERKGDQIWHRETLLNDGGHDVVLAEYPVHLAIGSGHHSRSYLVEEDGFLLESPITWYASKDAWGMSPGFEAAQSPGFERVADFGCVHCHAGRVEAVDDNRFRVKIHDQSISCESCHGPGSLHTQRHEQDDTPPDGEDTTIVNPAHLTRTEREAICSQCHLRGDASVNLRGRSDQDFRPGLRLNDFRADYVLAQPNQAMTVVGHVEQMRLSRCYQESAGLTCTTCHDPHAKPAEADRVDYFRRKCLTCHTEDACGLEPEARLAHNREDNCVACHMPQSPTDIPHFAFTHHRVGRHELNASPAEPPAEPATAQGVIGRLVPIHDLSHLPPLEQQRCLGLANLEVSDKQRSPAAHNTYRERAVRLLTGVHQAGLRDRDVEASLARIYWERNDLQRALVLAAGALEAPGTSGARANALFLLADSHLAIGQPGQALPYLQQLVTTRRQSEDWVLLGVCQRSLGRTDQAAASFARAAEISPLRPDVRQMLADLLQLGGDRSAADEQRQIASLLQQHERPKASDQPPRPGPPAGHEPPSTAQPQ